jgi:DNA invertase Pin-like site-specific DNA recombinase
MNGEQKITASHRQRLAVVYLRQSSLAQVRDNTESTLRQYDLAETAVRLGWPHAQVLVIDADLGCSGRQAASRAGLQDLVGRVCVGEVGIILVLEVSRLARSSADFARLLELARLADTLLADADGVYDLREFNDRLVLGIKSTISESELHLMAGRMHAARVSAAERGQLRCRLPIGYVYDDEGVCVLDPDEQVRAAVTDVFALFRQTGSAFGVVEAFRRRPFPRRVFAPRLRGSAAVGPVDQQPCAADAGQPHLRRGLRLRTASRYPALTAGRDHHHAHRPPAPGSVAGAHPRPPPRLPELVDLPGQPADPGR